MFTILSITSLIVKLVVSMVLASDAFFNGEYNWWNWNAHGHEFYLVVSLVLDSGEIPYSRRINVRQNTWSG